MPLDLTQQANALIDHIQARYHDGHRRALPELLAMAAVLEASGIGDGLVGTLRTIGEALEQHMFKEEMRLFPMMAQGGNTLIRHLVEDLHHEHVRHASTMEAFRARLQNLARPGPADPALQQFIGGVEHLADELARHIRAEDEELFPLFAGPTATAPSAVPG